MVPLGSFARLLGVGGVLGLAACSAGRTLVLGDGAPAYHFGPVRPVSELAALARTDNPTLTADLLEIYFTSDRGSGNGDLWNATRPSPDVPFEEPVALAELNTSAFETSSAISADGLTLWFGSDRSGGSGGTDIWVCTRPNRAAAWSTPANVIALNTSADDIPRPPGAHALVMPLASTKSGGVYHMYFASRPAPGAPFGAPVPVGEINHADRSTVDGFLSDDGLTLFFSSTPASDSADGGGDAGAAGKSDLYVAWRRSTGEAFSLIQPLDDLNTAGDERDPWLTPDGRTLYFTSDRNGELGIYTAAVTPR